MSAAKKILDEYWDGSLPVNPKALSHAMGLEVVADPFLIGQGLSGCYDVENGVPTSRFSPSESTVRQRFTIAHELGHHVLDHGPSFRDPVAHFTMGYSSPREREANRFAAELLMPDEAIEYLMRTMKNATVAKLAERFGVSQVAMGYRLKNLGWLDVA
jgi:uncharacterized protein DUF955